MTLAEQLAADGVDQWFVDAVDRLARNDEIDLSAYLESVGLERTIDGTKTTCRCHFVARDGNGRPAVKKLAKVLVNLAVDYAIPRSRIAEAIAAHGRSGSTAALVQLSNEARSLFAAVDRSGEGGEMLIFLLLEQLLGIPQIFAKISLKTNTQMHIHGTDGVHAKALPNGGLALYWCESKLYANVREGIDSCFDSIAPFLLDDGDGDSQTDLLLVRDHVDTADPELTEHLIRYFKEGDPLSLKREVRGASLIGFSLSEYPVPFEDDGVTVSAAINAYLGDWFQRVGTRVVDHSLDSFEMEVFLLPVPSVEEFRKAFRQGLGI